METQSAKASKFILNYGLLLGVLSVVLGVILYVTNSYLDPHWAYAVLGYAIFIAIVVMGIKAYKKANGTYLSIGEAIKVGVGIALIGGIIGTIWTLLLTNVIEPTYMDQMAEIQQEVMRERGMTEEQIAAGMEMAATFTSPWITSAIALVANLFFGLLVGLFAGLVMKNKNPYEA
ncbi:MAG TPA: DUF4199 domain-containing protein [Salinimicrobium sp.]|nr:DUF4199 domain-containing protein [Salinimicrobium sp.]